jgi:hypothetical protein
MPPDPASASVSVDRVANAFIAWAEENPGTYWWWPRDIRLDPDEVIADDGEGGTYRVPFTTDGEIDVTFGEAVEVRETFVDVPALRSRLQLSEEQLPDDATEEQINTVLASDPSTEPEPSPEPEPEPTPEPEPQPAPAAVNEPDPIAATQAQALQDTSARVAQLEAQAAQRAETERRPPAAASPRPAGSPS